MTLAISSSSQQNKTNNNKPTDSVVRSDTTDIAKKKVNLQPKNDSRVLSKNYPTSTSIEDNKNYSAENINKKFLDNNTLFAELQQEMALKIAHSKSEIDNQQQKSQEDFNNSQEGLETIEDPIEARIRQQLAIREAQRENEEEEISDELDDLDEESQEERLNQSKKIAQKQEIVQKSAEQVTKQAIKNGIRMILSSIGGAIISAISAILIFLSPILIPLIIVIFCTTLVINYCEEHFIRSTYYYITSNYEKLLINAFNNIPPETNITNNTTNNTNTNNSD